VIRPGKPALLLLEDGTAFRGEAVAPGTRFGEVVFNTSMTGYQEILTDPSYLGQIVVLTQPHIGNYGMNDDAAESQRPWAEGLVVRRATLVPSSHASRGGLGDYLRRHRLPCIEGIDTRALVRRLRDGGAQRGVLTTERTAEGDLPELRAELAAYPLMEGRELAHDASCATEHVVPAIGAEKVHLAVYDFGIKTNILRSLAARGARLTVLPSRTPAERVQELGVAGVVLSNGPGDPETLAGPIEQVKKLVAADMPILGICLGHQLLGLALGARTFKLKFGHHGGNQPVKDLETGKTVITSQNHGFAVDPESLPAGCRVTQVNLNDGTCEAFAVEGKPILSAQYHPEAAPGPHDASDLFGQFLTSVGAK
jgi:carbamoyl-phosphate synthase small subunit